MRSQAQLLGSRTRIKPRYAVLPLEGIPFSRLPEWPGAQARVLAAPVLGAGFAEYLLELRPAAAGAAIAGAHQADGVIEHFLYVLSGGIRLSIDGERFSLKEGGYALMPPTCGFAAESESESGLLMLRKRYEPIPGVPIYAPLVGNQAQLAGEAYYGDPGARLQTLIPGDLAYDLAMNIFTFEVGHSLPVTETHVMEHGLFVLLGKGVYFLDDEWMEVEATDFIWMGPFCPQSYYATGPLPSKYIYYKNVNRDIPL